jgi:DUF1680 family protein
MIQAMSATRRTFIGRSVAAAGFAALPRLAQAASAAAQDASGGSPAAPAAVPDVHSPLPPGAVRLGGLLGQRLDDCIRRGIGAQDVAALVAPFRVRDETWSWRTEFWGKWFTSAAWAWRYNQDPALRRRLDEAVAGLLATQTPDGYIGTYREEARLSNWDVWGRKYVLLGLLSYHELTGDAAALAAAGRSADYLLKTIGPGKYRSINDTGRWNGLASGSILEPVVRLYRATGEKRYLEFARWIVAQWGEYDGPRLVDQALQGVPAFAMFPKPLPAPTSYAHYGQSKAYEMMSCYEGLAELHRQTGESTWRTAVERLVGNVRDTEITIVGSGSSGERWCGGARRQHEPVPHWMETCVTATWIKLLAQVHRLGGDPRLVDDLERAIYNALLGALGADATWWSHYSPLAGVRGPAPEQCDMHQNCCVASGPRALALVPQLALMQHGEGPVVNLFCAGTARAATPSGGGVALNVETDYPAGDTVAIGLNPDRREGFALRLRVPGWSEATELRVNGESVPVEPGTYAIVRRTWAPGDTVTLKLDLRARAVAMPGGQPYTAVVRGPVVLAFDKRITRDLDGDGWAGLQVRAGAESVVEARPVAVAGGIRLALEVPFRSASGREATIRMCDYASAGETWSAASKLRVWLPHDLDGRDLFAGVADEPERP